MRTKYAIISDEVEHSEESYKLEAGIRANLKGPGYEI